MKKGMKKLVAVSTVSVMAAALLAGCGGSSSSSSAASSAASSSSSAAEASSSSAAEASSSSAAEASSSSAASTTEGGSYKVALIHQHQTNSFHIAAGEGADAKAAELGVELTQFSADQDAQKQISQIEQCIAEGYDCICFEPVDPDGLVDAAKEVMDAGIYCVNFSSTITGWEDIINGYAGASNEEAGQVEMEHVMELIGGKGDIAILTGPEADSGGLLRHAGYDKVLADYPDVNVVVEAAADWDTALGQSTAESWLVAYDLAAIVCENDGMAVGAGNAAGANSGIVITGVDASEDGQEAIADGRQTGTVAQDAATQGGLLIQMAYDLCSGTLSGLGNSVTCENIWVDADNLEAYQNGELS